MSSLMIRNVEKSLGGRKILSDVNLEVPQGEFLSLLGQSGCGKTTTLRCLAGLESPDAGLISIGGATVFDSHTNLPARKRGLGMVFQSYALWPHLTVKQNLEFGLRIRKFDAAERERRLDKTLALIGLTAFANKYPSELSGGQQQRVAVGRALVYEPEAILFDEPLSNLDAAMRDQLRLELRKVQLDSGFTAVYVTHDTREALSMSDSVALMHEGRIIQHSSPADLWGKPVDSYVANFLNIGLRITGRVEALSEGLCLVNVAGNLLRVAEFAKELVPGDDCSLLIRHAWVEPRDSHSCERGLNALNATIRLATMVGESQETDCTVGDQKVRVIADRRSAPLHGLGQGEEALICFNAAEATALPINA